MDKIGGRAKKENKAYMVNLHVLWSCRPLKKDQKCKSVLTATNGP